MENQSFCKNTFVKDIDYEELARDIFVFLRQDKSQRDLSRALGYSFNQVGKWESGHTRIKWSNFCDLLEYLDVEVEKHITKITNYYSLELDYREEIHKILIKGYALLEISEEDIHKKIKKLYTSNNKNIDLSIVLELLDYNQHILIYQLSEFFDCSKVSLLKEKAIQYYDRLDAIAENPLIPAVRAALETDAYQQLDKHCDKFVSIHSGAGLDVVRRCIAEMRNHFEIKLVSKKYKITGPGYSFSHSHNERLRFFNQSLFKMVADKYPVIKSEWDTSYSENLSMGSVIVSPVSKEVSKELAKLLSETHSKVIAILSKDYKEYKDKPKNNVQVITSCSFSPSILSQEEKKNLDL